MAVAAPIQKLWPAMKPKGSVASPATKRAFDFQSFVRKNGLAECPLMAVNAGVTAIGQIVLFVRPMKIPAPLQNRLYLAKLRWNFEMVCCEVWLNEMSPQFR